MHENASHVSVRLMEVAFDFRVKYPFRVLGHWNCAVGVYFPFTAFKNVQEIGSSSIVPSRKVLLDEILGKSDFLALIR